ncbi:MAG: alcohol dehydrogenase catalytic domain-containing protein [Roseiflexaceae bacterium]
MALIDLSCPAAGPGELLVRVSACGICGTDLLKLYSAAVAKPIQLGHEVVGVIAAVGAGVVGWSVGQRLALAHHVPCYVCHYCRHGNYSMCAVFRASNIRPGGFSEYVLASAEHVAHTALALPDDMPNQRAVFVEPLACCVRALKRIVLLPGDTALVVGSGAIGLLFLALLRQQPIQLAALDLRPDRLEQARDWGATLALDAADVAMPERLRVATGGRGVDLAVLTVANAATFAQALGLVRDGGTILIFGAKPADSPATTDLWELYRREITVISSYSPSPADLHEALEMLRRPDFALERLVTHQLPLDQINEGMRLARAQQAIKVLVRVTSDV